MAHIEGAVGELVDELKARKGESAGSVLRVVRSFNDPDGVEGGHGAGC